MLYPPLAIHISNGVLYWPWLALGFTLSAVLLAQSARLMTDDEIPRIGLLTAAFFVASLIHIRVGPTSVHLLLNGLVGVILRARCVLAIAVGLLLQAFLLGHGGFDALGVNIVVISLPALLARPAFRYLLQTQATSSFRVRDGLLAVAYILHPLLALPLFVGGVVFGHREQAWGLDADFRAGFVVGFLSVLATALLNAIVLVFAGIEDWRLVAVLVLAAHIPIAFIEGFVVGCAASYLRRVKPELLPLER